MPNSGGGQQQHRHQHHNQQHKHENQPNDSSVVIFNPKATELSPSASFRAFSADGRGPISTTFDLASGIGAGNADDDEEEVRQQDTMHVNLGVDSNMNAFKENFMENDMYYNQQPSVQ
ncbi:hypothetical protein L484_019859 [Morus notabilis]|uniref:Uncharacterized protein n=1 Tax=Morus notabilis TaxID=981085 RepID=W9SY44_9ROSA|nr:hypothetical protein L484_019859 [Morus notabilis]